MPADATPFLVRAQRSLEAQEFEEAKGAIREALDRNPEDARVRELYVQIHIADGVRRSRRARDRRRDAVRALDRKQRARYTDTPEVRQAFREAVASMDRVLEVAPDNAKALMLKAGVLDRMDRASSREEVASLFDRALDLEPGNEEIAYARHRVLSPCPHCEDTGVCPDCRGAGEVQAFLLRSDCPTCNATGICLRCGLF